MLPNLVNWQLVSISRRLTLSMSVLETSSFHQNYYLISINYGNEVLNSKLAKIDFMATPMPIYGYNLKSFRKVAGTSFLN